MSTLVLLPESYPLGGSTEPSFLEPEISPLAAAFDRVIIAPVMERGEQLPLPPGVEVDRSLLHLPGASARFSTILRPETWRRLNDDGRYIHSMRQAKAALAFSTYTFHYRRAIRELIARHGLRLDDTLFYTFWFEFMTSALAGIKGARIVTRAHGHDVYDSQNPFLSHSWRDDTLRALLACYPVSDFGTEYIRTDYPDMAHKVSTRRLGSPAPLGLNPAAGGDEITVMSIARVAREKRVGLLLDCMSAWAASSPGRRFRWIHVGDGPLMGEVRARAAAVPSNLVVELRGAMPNAEVHRLLAERHVDFTAMLSVSEGLPVAACESISYGVPVVATAVGGLPEIVRPSESGVLLSPHPVPGEFIERMERALPSIGKMRAGARELWEREFDAAPLRESFARELRNFLKK